VAAGHRPSGAAKHKTGLPVNPQENQAWQIGAATGVEIVNNLVTDIEHYPQLYPTQINKSEPGCRKMSHPNEGDFADDETVGASN